MIKKEMLISTLAKIRDRLRILEDSEKVNSNLLYGQNKSIANMNQKIYKLEMDAKQLKTHPQNDTTSTPVKKNIGVLK